VSSGPALAERALGVLRGNDTGAFFKPGPRVYPFQWNWDSALIALGLARFDPERGRTELRSLLRGQWEDGMVPHIVFHEPDPRYWPGPELWESGSCPGAPDLPTSGITDLPVLATAVRALHEADPDRSFLEEVVPAIESWHRWLHQERSDDSGLLAIVHPWESTDNSPRFDAALGRIRAEDAPRIERADRRHLHAEERPTDIDYDRYLSIVSQLRRHGYRPPSLEDSPFVYVDLCFNAILAVAEADLAWLWMELGEAGDRAGDAAERIRAALAARWDDEAAVYAGDEGVTGTVADVFPLYAGVPDEQQSRRLFAEALWSPHHYGPSAEAPWAVTSAAKSSAAFDSRRYWRGPVWVNINWFLIRGLERVGLNAEAQDLQRLTLELVERSGFSEYYEPSTGEPLGSDSFSWSAALTLDLLEKPA
jgi:glycogen debranching enzyme